MKTKTLLLSVLMTLPVGSAWADVTINETNFPDANFRSYLLSQSYGADGVITDAEIANVKSIYVFGMDIESLKGIEFFTALTEFQCFTNQLTSLDVSKNTALTDLDCSGNQLTSLDVSNNTALTYLSCGSNQLTSLDVSKNTALTSLSCHSNQLTSLDVSKNTALIFLHCYSNQITSLDVSKNTALISLTCYSNQLTSLDMSNNTSLTYLNCTSNQLTSLDVSGCTALINLYCYSNQLTSLDVSNNTALTGLSCYSNQLTSLDVSKNTKLRDLPCYRNQIKDTAMDAFIASLPTASSGNSFNVIYNEGEQNVMTTTQVAAAKAKNWIPFAYDGTTWVEYAGSTPSAVNNVKASGNNAPAAAVKSFKDGTFVIEDGINQFNAAGAQMK